jgi:hypothetical protein
MAHLIQFPKIIGENKIEQLRRVAPDYMVDPRPFCLSCRHRLNLRPAAVWSQLLQA